MKTETFETRVRFADLFIGVRIKCTSKFGLDYLVSKGEVYTLLELHQNELKFSSNMHNNVIVVSGPLGQYLHQFKMA